MTRRDFSRLAALAALAPCIPAAADDHSAAMFLNFDQLQWQKIVPELGDAGPEICMLRVDPNTQASKLMIRAPAGFHVPRHWHSANETHTVVKGACTFQCDDGEKTMQGPGAFSYIPAKMIHQAWMGEEEVVVFITVDGAWDINWVDGPPGPQKT